MPEISVKDQLKKLVDLQKIDGEIYQLKVASEEKPVVIEHLKVDFEKNKDHLKALEDKFKSVQLDRKGKELELKTKEEEIAKANIQLTQLKTNKEYSAKMTEIEHIKADKSIVEEKILISYDDGDAVGKEMEKEKTKVADLEKNFLTKKKEIEEEVRQMEERIKTLEAQRKQIIPGVDPSLLSRYERILEHKQGIAIAPIKDSSCGGCFMNIPTQTINEIKMHDHLVVCEMCTRILYLEDDL